MSALMNDVPEPSPPPLPTSPPPAPPSPQPAVEVKEELRVVEFEEEEKEEKEQEEEAVPVVKIEESEADVKIADVTGRNSRGEVAPEEVVHDEEMEVDDNKDDRVEVKSEVTEDSTLIVQTAAGEHLLEECLNSILKGICSEEIDQRDMEEVKQEVKEEMKVC